MQINENENCPLYLAVGDLKRFKLCRQKFGVKNKLDYNSGETNLLKVRNLEYQI